MPGSAACSARSASTTSSGISRPKPTHGRRPRRRCGAGSFPAPSPRPRATDRHGTITSGDWPQQRAAIHHCGLARRDAGVTLPLRRSAPPAASPQPQPKEAPMAPHTYLEQGLSVLRARLRTPSSIPGARQEIRPFVTLSREAGAGATTLGRELIPLLDREFRDPAHAWVFLDRDLLTQALTHHQLPARLAEYLPEDRVSEIRAAIGELVGLHPSLWQLGQKVSEAILQLAHVGHVVFSGRAAHLVTRALPGGLHVRLVAPRDVRIARTATALKLSREKAEAHIDRQDEARRRFVRSNFDQDIEDPHSYDLVINTDRVSAASAARLVVAALRERMAQAQPAPAPLVTA
ncbi:MAG: hypothetical protein C0502_00860 [Opitutus sp.]|nr:hypothetical protein [Opitutus sp.]